MVSKPPDQKHEPWSESERQALLDMARESAHRKWLWALIRRWGLWGGAFFGGGVLTWESLTKLLKKAASFLP